MTEQIDKLVDQWLEVDINPKTRREIQELQSSKNYDELSKRLAQRIAFGTAGLRSAMTAGFAHMNDVTVLQATQGLVQYLVENWKESKELSIVVGHDHRHNSQRFAELTASAALLKGFKVYYLGSTNALSADSIELSKTTATGDIKFASTVDNGSGVVCHTPMVPFSIDYYGASAGVMVTASHNPAQDNGYKVYYGNGCQIIPPHDAGIAHSIDDNLVPWSDGAVWDITKIFSKGISSGKLVSVKEAATAKYIEKLKGLVQNPKIDFKFEYTPVHGVGLEIFLESLNLFENGKDYVRPVKEQSEPNPDFPTVSFPNPEEKGALDLAISDAEKQGYKLVVANDPDADRFSVAVKAKTGEWKQLTGNEIGFLFAMWVIENTDKEDLKNLYLVNSTVSSQVLKAMADQHGFHFQDTLTGFKWIGNKAIDLKKEGYIVPFGYEEAIGYMFDSVNDKDGIAAAVVWLQLYQSWFYGKEDSYTAIDKLEEGYNLYGWFKECNGYYKLDDLSKTPYIFDKIIRQSYSGHDFPANIGPEFKVIEWRDLTIGYQSDTPDNKPVLPSDPSSQMISAKVIPTTSSVAAEGSEHVYFTCRGSGTEPKLKVYIEAKANGSDRSTELARLCWSVLKREWFKPEENGLSEVV